MKPWQGGPAAIVSPEAFVSAAASPPSSGAAPNPTETPRIAEPEPSRGPLLVPGWSDVAPTAGVHDEWGIRVITAGYSPGTVGGQGMFAGQWYPHVRDGGPPIRIDPINDARLALGITFPRDSVPLDVRFWRIHDEGGLEWLPTYPINDVPGQGANTYLQRTADGTVVPWERVATVSRSWWAGPSTRGASTYPTGAGSRRSRSMAGAGQRFSHAAVRDHLDRSRRRLRAGRWRDVQPGR